MFQSFIMTDSQYLNIDVQCNCCLFKTSQLSYRSEDKIKEKDTCCSTSFPTFQSPLLKSNYQVIKYMNVVNLGTKLLNCQIFLSTLCIETGFEDAYKQKKRQQAQGCRIWDSYHDYIMLVLYFSIQWLPSVLQPNVS